MPKSFNLMQEVTTSVGFPFTDDFSDYIRIVSDGPIIPGLFQGAVPQGMAYNSPEDRLLISHYMFDGRPSCISVISMEKCKHINTFWLLNPDGSPHRDHVGGLAVNSTHLFIASEKGVNIISLQNLKSLAKNKEIQIEQYVPTEVKASFATYNDNILWVGEFTSTDGSYRAAESHHVSISPREINHGWMAGYVLRDNSNIVQNLAYPDYLLSIPPEVQGAVFTGNKIILSRSYGRRNNSRLTVYEDPRTSEPDRTIVLNGRELPLWILKNSKILKEITVPPMSEAIALYRDSPILLYESGADNYRTTTTYAKYRIDILENIFRD
ncbi:MAG: hypothetical protein JEY91_09070 [Spirochaetaceae bacterium]|nr:hypothetical protein [Spirochaetaceae bacterium]